MQGGAPVLVLNSTTKREHGRKAQLANILAAKSVSDIIRTTLGPRSMLKMILDPMGGIVMTNDGNAILREVDVSHPAAKSMIELSRTQDEEVGDGTTSVIILAGELLAVSEPLLKRNMHPRVIVGAYAKALDDVLREMERIAVNIDTSKPDQVMSIVRSCLGTKFVSRFGDMVCRMALDAVQTITTEEGKRREIDIKRYARVEKIPGGFLDDSKVLKGVMINKDVTHPRMKRKIVNPRILLLDCPLEYKKLESQTNIDVRKEGDWDAILRVEEDFIEKMCADIIAHKPTVVVTEKGVSDLAQHFLMKAGISVLRRMRKTDNNRVARVCGATIVHEPSEIKESDIGTECGLFEVSKIGDEYFAYFIECKNPKACTVILRGASKDVLNEIERNLLDAMNVARNILLDPRVLPGGGATEIHLGQMLRNKAKSITNVQQWPYKAVASALEVIPRTLIENCGASTIRLLTELRAKHAQDKSINWGVDGNKGELADMSQLQIWDPFQVKAQTVKTAIEAGSMLLRIDDILSGMKGQQDKQQGGAVTEDVEEP